MLTKEKKILMTMFFVERHLDVVLEDPLVVGAFFVERHLDVVHEDSLVVKEKSLFYKTCRYSRMGDAYQISP